MIRKIALTTLAAMLCAAAELPLLERFDSTANLKGTLSNGAELAIDEGLEKGALKASGDGAPNRIIYSVDLPATGGKQYALALDYRTSKLQNYAFRIDVIYKGSA